MGFIGTLFLFAIVIKSWLYTYGQFLTSVNALSPINCNESWFVFHDGPTFVFADLIFPPACLL